MFFFFFKQKTAYEMRISDWSSDVCSSDLAVLFNLLEGPIFLFAGKGCRTVHVDVVDRIHDHAFEAISDDALKLDTVASQFLFGLLEQVVGLGLLELEIGRASCRERVCQYVWIEVAAVSLQKKRETSR